MQPYSLATPPGAEHDDLFACPPPWSPSVPTGKRSIKDSYTTNMKPHRWVPLVEQKETIHHQTTLSLVVVLKKLL